MCKVNVAQIQISLRGTTVFSPLPMPTAGKVCMTLRERHVEDYA